MTNEHCPVLMEEVVAGLAIKADGIYIDATFGRGGHSAEILQRLGPQGRLIALDKDPAAVEAAKLGPCHDARFCIEHVSYAELLTVVSAHGCIGKVDGILIDCGVSSPQLDDPERGFSFTREGPLDMRMNTQQGMDAATWIASAAEADIRRVLWEFGEERFSRRISKAIVESRSVEAITTTRQLVDIIVAACPVLEKHKHPATRSFQAIRIYINQELAELKACLAQSVKAMSVGGRLCVISFHSLEDRIVKRFIRREAEGEVFPSTVPLRDHEIKRQLRKVGGLIRPSDKETAINPRARSARLRIAEKLG